MCLEQEYKPRSKNTKLKFKNHKPRNTNINPATDLPCQHQTQTQQLIFLVNQTQKQQTYTQTSVRNGYEELTIMDFFKFVFSEDPDQP